MFITINGQLGSGKSAVCDILARQGYDIFSTGRIQRDIARDKGLSTLELNRLCSNDYNYDYLIDGKSKQYAKDNADKDIIFDSRLAWHFITPSFKVRLLVSPYVASLRVFANRKAEEETFSSIEDAQAELDARYEEEVSRYKTVYNVDVTDFSNYNLIIDTTTISPEKVAELILSALDDYKNNPKLRRVYVSPSNIYPTLNVDTIRVAKVDYFIEQINCRCALPKLEVLSFANKLYIYTGHTLVVSANLAHLGYLEALIYSQDDTLPNGLTVGEYIKKSNADLVSWQTMCGFNYKD
ncbi:MAG: cytidylate kinase family protein [Clostridia bacterium]